MINYLLGGFAGYFIVTGFMLKEKLNIAIGIIVFIISEYIEHFVLQS